MTPGARRVLQELSNDEDCDLIQEGRLAYCGYRPTTPRIVYELLGCMAISISWKEGTNATYYHINDTGRALLRRPELEREIAVALGKGPFSIIDDQIVYI